MMKASMIPLPLGEGGTRAPQSNKPGWAARFMETMRAKKAKKA